VSVDRNREVVLRFFDAYNERNYELLGRCLADDFVSNVIPEALGHGRQALFAFLRMSFDAFPNIRNDVLDVVAEGDLAAARVGVTGTHEGEFLGIPASGNTLEFEDAHFFRLNENGEIVEHWNYYDKLTVLQQLGVITEDIGG
jgi:steroid delta-isomerase-like uncharacterized protein